MFRVAASLLCITALSLPEDSFLPSQSLNLEKIAWEQLSDFDPEIVDQLTWDYVKQDPVDVVNFNQDFQDMHDRVMSRHNLTLGLELALKDASFSKLTSHGLVSLFLCPFSDDSKISLNVDYKKAISFPQGLTNKGVLSVVYEGETYRKARFAFLKYFLPRIIIDSERKMTIREYFDEGRADTSQKLDKAMAELRGKPDSEYLLANLRSALFEFTTFEAMFAMKDAKTMRDFVKAIKPQLKKVREGLDMVDPRPWFVKLFSGYKLEAEDCQLWDKLPLTSCKPHLTISARLGVSGVTKVWGHMKFSESGVDIGSTAYAPTYGTSWLAGSDVDKFVYGYLKFFGAHFHLPEDMASLEDDMDHLATNVEESEEYATFLAFQAEYDAFDWEKEDFGWDEDRPIEANVAAGDLVLAM
eukprot:GDKH01001460.1.p1 GENE.GDKH01001460.1~~GDKH01001460.1.p1  ORF type:complete len:413 (-),score=93.43 GDKH01001460.1:334-1572(-)